MERVTDWFEIAEIHLSHIRGFRKLALDLRDSNGQPRKRLLVIGKNGTCKSTLLRAIAVGLASHTDASRLISEPLGGLVAEKVIQGSIMLQVVELGGKASKLEIWKKLERYRGDQVGMAPITIPSGSRPQVRQPSDIIGLGKQVPFVCGYGAGRFGAGPDSGRSYRIGDSVATLFQYQQTLIDPELTLRRLGSIFGTKIYYQVLGGIKRALGLLEDDTIELRPAGGVFVSGPTVGKRATLEGWADGYRLTFSWILDLYAWALRAGSISEDGHIEGILLIDEIEQHLHPSMQAEILPRLSELLPKMQIIATTHSPLVALDAKPEELIVLRRKGDHVVAEENVPDFSGYSAEDMLADPRLFDTEVYGTETREKLSEYRDLAAVPKEERSLEQRHKLRSLATEIGSLEGPKGSENETSRLLKELMTKYGL